MNDIVQRAIEIYGCAVLRKSAMNIRGGAGVFERILGQGQYKTVLEIGTYRGVSAAAMAPYCDRIITIDLKFGRMEHHEEEFDRAAFWKSLDIGNIQCHLVKDNIEKAQLINSMEFDLAFIDGGKDDIAWDFELVRRCGTVLFHDYDDRGQPALNTVFDFVNSLPRNEVEVMDIFALWRAPL